MLILESIELKTDESLQRVLEITPLEPVGLDTVVVRGEKRAVLWYLRDFYERRERARGLGSFLTPEDIERLAPVRPAELVRRLDGFTLRMDQTIEHSRYRTSCPPLIFIDGLPALNVRSAEDLSDRLWVDQIVAVEGYNSPARIPPEYNQTGSACGVISFWTKK